MLFGKIKFTNNIYAKTLFINIYYTLNPQFPRDNFFNFKTNPTYPLGIMGKKLRFKINCQFVCHVTPLAMGITKIGHVYNLGLYPTHNILVS
jgi:hypothetical protein